MHPVQTLVRTVELRDDDGKGLVESNVASAAETSEDLLEKCLPIV